MPQVLTRRREPITLLAKRGHLHLQTQKLALVVITQEAEAHSLQLGSVSLSLLDLTALIMLTAAAIMATAAANKPAEAGPGPPHMPSLPSDRETPARRPGTPLVCTFNDRTAHWQVATRSPDKPGLGLPDSRLGPFTVPSCGLRVFYKGTVFCAPPSSDLQRLCRI
jgi:hypothetical protein